MNQESNALQAASLADIREYMNEVRLNAAFVLYGFARLS
jgi:hypothetical protein